MRFARRPSGPLDPVVEFASTLVIGLPDAAIALDRDLLPIAANRSYLEMASLRARELESQIAAGTDPFTVLGHTPERDRASAEECMAEGRVIHLAEVAAKNRVGGEFTIYQSFMPIVGATGEPAGVIVLFRDFSGEARLQERYREMLALEQARAAELERQVQERTRELSTALEEVTRLSRHDPLTGLLNRRAFAEPAQQALALAKRHQRNVGILVCDLDFFKKLNDTFGHQAGDLVLVETAKALMAAVRTSDRVARFGGEEFVVLLTETDPGCFARVAERCRQAVAAIPLEEHLPGAKRQTVSIGAAMFPLHGDDIDRLIAHADQALYAAKTGGRNRVVVYDDSLKAESTPTGPSAEAPRILVVGLPEDEGMKLAELVATQMHVTVLTDTETALAHCRREPVDAVVAAHHDSYLGAELLRRSLRERPDAVRALVIDSKGLFLEVRGGTLARIDTYLLREEAQANLGKALDDAFARRELDRKRLLLSGGAGRQFFQTRIAELDEVLANDLLDFYYQPIVDLSTGTPHAYEALCRARHPVLRDPQLLFEAALHSGNIWRVGRVARRLAVEQSRGKIPDVCKLFVNLHPAEIEDEQLLESPPGEDCASRIVFEITERASIGDFPDFQKTMELLHARGYEFAIDDLGAGYASLNAVALLGPQYVKLDMAMIRDIDRAERNAQLVRRMVDFANDVGLKIIAEGIETRAEADKVTSLGCHLGQGYLFGRPSLLP